MTLRPAQGGQRFAPGRATTPVASQKAEGWVLLPTVYEDAGLSGGTLERPGLQRLLADIDAGLVD